MVGKTSTHREAQYSPKALERILPHMVGNRNAHRVHQERKCQSKIQTEKRSFKKKHLEKHILSSFIVIAYDITDDRRRYRVVKALKQYGTAINMSVYVRRNTNIVAVI